MPTYATFFIKDKDLLIESLTKDPNENLGQIIEDYVTEFKSSFKGQKLPIKGTTNYLNDILNNKESFTEPMFNAFLCYLFFDDYITSNNQNRTRLEKFYRSISLPEKRLNDKKQRGYNVILEQVTKETPSFKEHGLSMNSNWNLFPSKKEVITQKVKKHKFQLAVIVLLVLITIGVFLQVTYGESTSVIPEKKIDTFHCVFAPDSTKHQILILPFKDIAADKKKEDSGFTIFRRLDSLNVADQLNMEIKFCKSLLLENDDLNYFKQVRKSYNANHIIYGFYALGDCNSNDKICLNYITEYISLDQFIASNYTQNSFGNFKQVSLEDLNNGALQENLDFLIYFNAMIAAVQIKKPDDALRYSQILLKNNPNEKGMIYLYRALSYSELRKDDLALIELHKSLRYPDVDIDLAHFLIGYFYALYDQNKRAKYYLEKVKKVKINEVSYRDLYVVNNRLGLYQDNLEYLTYLSKAIPDKKYQFLLWKSSVKRKMGLLEQSIKDSTEVETYLDINPEIRESTYRSIAPKTFIKTFKTMRIDQIESKKVFGSENIKNIDSLKKDICRVKTFEPDYLKERHLSPEDARLYIITRENCESLWPKVFSYDAYSDK